MLKKKNSTQCIYFLEFLKNKKKIKTPNFSNYYKIRLEKSFKYVLNNFKFKFFFSNKFHRFLSKNFNHKLFFKKKKILNYNFFFKINSYYIDSLFFFNHVIKIRKNKHFFFLSFLHLNFYDKKIKKIKKKKNKLKTKITINNLYLLRKKFKKLNKVDIFKKIKIVNFITIFKIKQKKKNKKQKKQNYVNKYKNLKRYYIKTNKIIKKIKYLKHKIFIKKKKIISFKFFKKIKLYNNTNNNVFYNLIENYKLNINYHTKVIKDFSIFDFLFLNNRNLQKYYLNFYLHTLPNLNKKTYNISLKKHFIKNHYNDIQYKNKLMINKKKFRKENITFFFNLKKGQLTTFRGARSVHWKNFKKQKRINSRKYTNFIKLFLKKKNKISIIFSFFLLKFNLSFNFLLDFFYIYMYFFKKKIYYNEIYQLPIDIQFWNILKKKYLKKLKIDSKINSWLIKTVKINSTFWMDKKKKNPNFLKKKSFFNNTLNNHIQYDFLTNYFIIFKKKNFLINLDSLIYKNKFLKLNNYKYKS